MLTWAPASWHATPHDPPWMAACWKKLSGSVWGSAFMAVMAWMYRSCGPMGGQEAEKEVCMQADCKRPSPAACTLPFTAPVVPGLLRSNFHPCSHSVLGVLGLAEDLGDLDALMHDNLAHVNTRHAGVLRPRLVGEHGGCHIAQVAAVATRAEGS